MRHEPVVVWIPQWLDPADGQWKSGADHATEAAAQHIVDLWRKLTDNAGIDVEYRVWRIER